VFIWVNSAGHEETLEISKPGYKGETIGRMELLACIEALKEAQNLPSYCDYEKITIYSDSQYVVSNIDNMKYAWYNSKWVAKSGSPILNASEWKELRKLYKKIPKRIKFVKVKGHSKKFPHNKTADRLARISANNATNNPLSRKNVRRKKTPNKVIIGSVVLSGQKLRIRVVEDEYLKEHKTNRYRYEVMSPKSKFFKCVDFAYSDIVLWAGHEYWVTFNKDRKNPRILKLIEEVMKQAV